MLLWLGRPQNGVNEVVVLFCFHRVAKLNIPPMMANMDMYCTLQNSKKKIKYRVFL
jgi:hypothetical protein